jgi:hypothetical protein
MTPWFESVASAKLHFAGTLMHGNDWRYGARFSTEFFTRGCHWFPRLLA